MMSSRAIRNVSAIVFLLAGALFLTEATYADCENPVLSWTVTVTGPESECVDAVEEDIQSGEGSCGYVCFQCGRHWEFPDYSLQYPGCREVPTDPTKSESGSITCHCGPAM